MSTWATWARKRIDNTFNWISHGAEQPKEDIQLVPLSQKQTQLNDIGSINEPWNNRKINKESVATQKREWKRTKAYKAPKSSNNLQSFARRIHTTFHSALVDLLVRSARTIRIGVTTNDVSPTLCTLDRRPYTMLSHYANSCIRKHHSSTSLVSFLCAVSNVKRR